MIKNYGKIAWRNLIRHKAYAAINTAGLALGMASSLLILLWVHDELSIGAQYPKAAQLYRVMENEIADGRTVTDEDTPGILASELKKQFPEVVYAAGMSDREEHVLTVGGKTTRQMGHYAGADWFNLYGVQLLIGTPETAINRPGSIAISAKMAAIYFGSPQRAVGKSIRFDNWLTYQVTAVFANLPASNPEHYEYVLNWADYQQREPWTNVWENTGPRTRLQLRPDADVAKVNAKLKSFLEGRSKDINASYKIELFLQPETEAYLYSNFRNGQRDGGRIEYVRLFVIVAVFLLLIAGINFMNLATARSVKRAREVGVRKVVGADRASLIGQFMGEAMLLTSIALVVAVALVMGLLPVFNQLTDKQLTLPISQPGFWLSLLALLVLMGSLAGSYPALFLSSLDPVRVLKGTMRFGAGAQLLRRGLVVFQFVLSMLMIVGTVVIYRQLQYIQTKNLGYDRENLIRIRSEGELAQKFLQFKQALTGMAGIESVTFLKTNPLQNGNTTDGVNWAGKDPTLAIQFNNTSVGYDYARTMGMKIIRGRDFSADFGTDSTNYLINQTAAQRMGYADPVGKPLTFWGKPGRIVGLIEDFHFNSLHVAIRPLIVRFQKDDYWGNILIRTHPDQTRQALASIEVLCRKMNPKFPFAYSFIDTEYEERYKSETIIGTLASVFACLAIFIACLGLFGLAAFTAEQRTKEIGVRKVLGATVSSVVLLLSKDFLKLVLVAVVIASPLGWYVMNEWLKNFAYRIEIHWWVFGLAGLLAVGIALLTISFQSIKAALMNPINSLRND